MDCCSTKSVITQGIVIENKDGAKPKCPNCTGVTRSVTKKTMLLMLKPELFERVSEVQYHFCASPDCRVVYFPEGQGTIFYTEDLRLRVGTKEKDDPKPLCYCFGFDEADLRNEIAATWQTSIPNLIAELLKADICACEARNPSGACCLGDITKAIKRLQSENAEAG